MKITIQSPQNQANPPPQYRPAERPIVSLSPGIRNNPFLHSNKPSPISQTSYNYNPPPQQTSYNYNPPPQWSATPRNTNKYKSNPFLPSNPSAPRMTPAPTSGTNFQPVVTINPNSGRNPFLPFRPSHQTPGLPPRPTPPEPPVTIGNWNECGMSSSSGRPNLLIVNGNKISRGQWPWLAAIFIKVGIKREYICSGSVLTTRHILTAGHCLKTNTSETVSPDQLAVALGRYKLLDFNEEGSVNRDVARHISHPDYTHTESGDSDLAILILRSSVEFTAFIRPICLESLSFDPHRSGSRNGFVVGWGADEAGHRYTEEPRMANMPIVASDVCLRSHPSMYRLTSERTFCAGWRNHSGPCNGDSGSGLMILDHGRYRLRGIVSRSVFDNQLMCDQTQFVVYVDVFKYLTWINQQMYST